MEESDKVVLRRNNARLCDCIAPQVDNVIEYLYVDKIITDIMMDNIIEVPNIRREKVFQLLRLITTRGARAFDSLYNGVIRYELYDAADILRPENAPHRPQNNRAESTTDYNEDGDDEDKPSDTEGIQETWPSNNMFNDSSQVQSVGEDDTTMRTLYNNALKSEGEDPPYLMSDKTRGRALILINDEFSSLKKREGAFEDRKALEQLFRSLHFKTQVKKNKTKEDMWNEFTTELQNADHKNSNCFVLVILSHGYRHQAVFGSDGTIENNRPVNSISSEEILNLLCGSEALQGKPKLIFIQADETDKSEPECGAGSSKKDSSFSTDSPTLKDPNIAEEEMRKTEDAQNKTEEGAAKSGSNEAKVPLRGDVYMAISSTPGNLKLEGRDKGTGFVQALAYIFAKFAHKHDINKLMTMVQIQAGKDKTAKQQIWTTLRLRKNFYFFPSLHSPLDKQ